MNDKQFSAKGQQQSLIALIGDILPGLGIVDHRSRQIDSLIFYFECDRSSAIHYLQLRKDGHSQFEAAVLAGLRDTDR